MKIAVIDSGLEEHCRNDQYITYKNFITEAYPAEPDNPRHGTNSVALIRKVFGRAKLYVAKVFRSDEADDKTPYYMAEVRILIPVMFGAC